MRKMQQIRFSGNFLSDYINFVNIETFIYPTDAQLDCSKNLYFRTVHVVIFILFKPTHALFLKHIHIHI